MTGHKCSNPECPGHSSDWDDAGELASEMLTSLMTAGPPQKALRAVLVVTDLLLRRFVKEEEAQAILSEFNELQVEDQLVVSVYPKDAEASEGGPDRGLS
jgi:hypothetical protein